MAGIALAVMLIVFGLMTQPTDSAKQAQMAHEAKVARESAEEQARLAREAETARHARETEAARKVADEEESLARDAEATKAEASKKATKGSPFENSLGMKLVPVPGTEVLFSVWNTRVKDFRAYAEAVGYRQHRGIWTWDGIEWGLDENASWERPGFAQTPYHPVVGVSWDEAKAFCEWLTRKERGEGKIGKDKEYRLPTDAEWSVAVGSGKYPWGSEWPPPKRAWISDPSLPVLINATDAMLTAENVGPGNYDPSLGVDSYVNTSPCGNLTANRCGLYDMGGNVWQWCEDWYRASMNENEVLEKHELLKVDGGGQKYRVVRGGSWADSAPEDLLSSSRYFGGPVGRSSRYGFRCVLGSLR